MKRLLAALAFANLAVFGYLHLVAPPPPAAPAPAAVPRLALVGERATPAKAADLHCVSIGPLRDADVAHAAADYLKGLNLAPRERTQEGDASPAYWVVATRKSAALAARLVQQLRAAGVADVELVPPAAGQTDAQVSLGMFGERAQAEQRIRDLKKFEPGLAIVEQPRRLSRWWLDIETPAAGAPVDVAALVKAVPNAAGAALGPCVLQLPPADPEGAPNGAQPPKTPAKTPGAPA